MSSAAGLRDLRLRLYTRSDAGSGGFVRAVFTFSVERWGRLDESAASVSVLAARLQLKLDALVEFADEVTVPVNSVLKDPSGIMWWVRGINSNRILRRIFVGVERITDEQVATFTLYEGNSTLDGVHLIDPAT